MYKLVISLFLAVALSGCATISRQDSNKDGKKEFGLKIDYFGEVFIPFVNPPGPNHEVDKVAELIENISKESVISYQQGRNSWHDMEYTLQSGKSITLSASRHVLEALERDRDTLIRELKIMLDVAGKYNIVPQLNLIGYEYERRSLSAGELQIYLGENWHLITSETLSFETNSCRYKQEVPLEHTQLFKGIAHEIDRLTTPTERYYIEEEIDIFGLPIEALLVSGSKFKLYDRRGRSELLYDSTSKELSLIGEQWEGATIRVDKEQGTIFATPADSAKETIFRLTPAERSRCSAYVKI